MAGFRVVQDTRKIPIPLVFYLENSIFGLPKNMPHRSSHIEVNEANIAAACHCAPAIASITITGITTITTR
jgi:hypothetical protein